MASYQIQKRSQLEHGDLFNWNMQKQNSIISRFLPTNLPCLFKIPKDKVKKYCNMSKHRNSPRPWHWTIFIQSLICFQLDRLDPMQNQMCRVCEEPAAGFHFGAFTCEGCKSFFGRTCNNQTVIQECKNNYQCVVDKKNRTACKACRLRKCLMVGMSKSGSRYGRRSNWFKIHCLMQQSMQQQGPSPHHRHQAAAAAAAAAAAMAAANTSNGPVSPPTSSSLSPTSPPARPWSITSKSESKDDSFRLRDDRSESPDSEPPTMVPRPNAAGYPSPLSGSNPFTSLLRPASPISNGKHIDAPLSPPITSAAQLSSLYGFPGFSLMSTPGFPSLPLHKQTLLSPLLANPHFWQAAVRHPLLTASSLRPELDLMAEHKALMERFATSMSAAAALATRESPPSPRTPPPRPTKSPGPPQNMPMDLSNKKGDSSDEEDFRESIKSDLNRNVLTSRKKDESYCTSP